MVLKKKLDVNCKKSCIHSCGFEKEADILFNKPRESCGVFGILAKDPSQQVSQMTYHGLMALQHRGQEAAGISVVNGSKKIFTYKNLGLVSEVLTPDILKKYWGNVSIGHVRYGTAGSSSVNNAQPYHFESTYASFSLVFNGNIANYDELKTKMMQKGRVFTTNSDTEVIANLIAATLLGTNDMVEALQILPKFLDGSYALIILTQDGDLYAIRDPTGFKPLSYGVADIGCKYEILASETCAFDALGARFVRDIKPGEIVHCSIDNELHTECIIESDVRAICMFEYVYFARPDSVIDGVSVEIARNEMGRNLAKSHPVNSRNAVVVPVPDSGRSASIGFAEESGIPYGEGLMKNRYVWRTFIMPGQDRRMNMVRQKLNPVKPIIAGKEVVLIDDSIVRGTTTAFIVKLLKQAGASKVHVRIACPPVIEPCYMGVDFPTKLELIAGKEQMEDPLNFLETIRKQIGADTLGYNSIEGLVKSLGIPKDQLCMACINGVYPLKNDPRKLNIQEVFTKKRTE
jgi:amidophosphoribosyltransferase